MFQHLKKILGDKLYLDPPKPEEFYLPSPFEMKGRILLKGKKLSTNFTGSEGEVTDEDEGAEMSQRMTNRVWGTADPCTQEVPALQGPLRPGDLV